jgi:recombinational DNA repair protein (RecF pathway)
MSDGLKRCSKCGETKPLAEFSPKGKAGRVQSWCKRCAADHALVTYYASKEAGARRRQFWQRPGFRLFGKKIK